MSTKTRRTTTAAGFIALATAFSTLTLMSPAAADQSAPVVVGATKNVRPSARAAQVTFAPRSDGSIVGIRYYKRTNRHRTMTATVRSTSGGVVARERTTATRAGWKSVAFDPAAAVRAGRSYTVTLTSPRSAGRLGRHVSEIKVMFKRRPPAPTAPKPAPVVTVPKPTPSPSGPSIPPSAPSSTKRNCVSAPGACGYPDASSTGVPAGTVLKKSGSVSASTDGQVIDGLDITGEINVTASNVVIKNTRVSNSGGDWVVIIRPGAKNLTIQDSEIMAPAGVPQDNACVFNISDETPTLKRLNIHGCSAAVSTGGGLLEDSYLHDPGYTEGLSHITLVASNGGGGLTVRHNTILNPHPQTAAVAFYQDFGPQANDLIENNLLSGGGYTVYGGDGGKGKTSNIRFLNNRFGRNFYNTGGYYGYLASFTATNPGNAWSGNYWDDTLTSLGN